MFATTLITNVDVFDGMNEKLIEKADVLVKGKLKKIISAKMIEASDGLTFLSKSFRIRIMNRWKSSFKSTEVASPTNPQQTISDEAFELTCQFVIQMTTQAHCYGVSSYRLESYFAALPPQILGIHIEIYATPTYVNFVFWRPTDTQQSHFSIRLPVADYNLTKLAALGEMMNQIKEGQISVAEGTARLKQIDILPLPYKNQVVAIGYGLCGASIAVLLSASWGDVVAAALLSLAVFMVLLWGARFPRLANGLEVLAALVASLLANIIALLFPGSNPFTVAVCAVIVLVPGLALTQGMAELAAKSILSGMDHLVDGVLITVKLFVGALMGSVIINALWAVPPPVVPPDMPMGLKWLAVALLMLGLAFVFQIPDNYMGWAILAGIVAYAGVWLGNQFGTWQGSFFGALFLGIYTGLFTRRLHYPGSMVILPGIMILVPGVAAYFGLSTLGDSGVISGITDAWGVVVQISAIVTGLVVAMAIVPQENSL